jgi:NitT/TauT family transport system permease protein
VVDVSAARVRAVVAPVTFFVVFVSLWQAHVFNDLFGLEEFAIPLPDQILSAAGDNGEALRTGFRETFEAVALGWLFGNALGFALALGLLALPAPLARRVGAVFASVQALPIIALAPLVALWIDASMWFKATTVVIMVFPAMVVYAYRGLTNVDATALELARSYDASGWQVFRMIRLPSAVPHVFTALRYSVVLALIGVVVCEILRSADGLGYEIHDALQRFETAQAWAAVAILALAGIVGYALLLLVERLLVPWSFRRP